MKKIKALYFATVQLIELSDDGVGIEATSFYMEAHIYLNKLSSSELRGTQKCFQIKIAGKTEDNGFFAYLCIIWYYFEHSEWAAADGSDSELPVMVEARTIRRVADFLHQVSASTRFGLLQRRFEAVSQ